MIKKEDLVDLYINKSLPQKDIAIQLNVSKSTVSKYIKEYGLTKNITKKLNFDIKLLSYMYIEKDMTVKDMAIELNCDRLRLSKFLKNNNIIKPKNNIEKYNLTKDSLNEYYNIKDHTMKETAEYFHVNSNTLKRYLKKYNLYKTYEKRSKDLARSIEKGNLKKYGIKNISQLEDVKQKKINSIEKHYNVDHLMHSKVIKDRLKKTMMDRYNVINDSQRKSHADSTRKKSMSYPEKIKYATEFADNPSNFIDKYFKQSIPTYNDISELTGINLTSVGQYILDNNLKSHIKINYSIMENQISNFLNSLNINNIQRCNRKIIKPYELDFYLKDYNFAIECNPTITHNSTIGYMKKDNIKKISDYHKIKTDMCNSKNISLLHIFGYEWEDSNKQGIIKSIIKDRLKLNERIFARKTTINLVDNHTTKKFLEENHRQGYVPSKISIGLYYNDKLYSLMTFGKLRNSISKEKNIDDNNSYELLRFVTLKEYTVVGGATKLFKYFIKNYYPNYIKTYADRAHTTGKVYSILGFKFSHISKPSYIWVNYRNNEYLNRLSTQKRKLPKLFNEDIDLNKTEKQIMIEHGFVQVFNSGNDVYEWKNI